MVSLRSNQPSSSRPARTGMSLPQRLAGVTLLGLLASACQSGSPETTGSIGGLSLKTLGRAPSREVVTLRDVDALGQKYNADQNDVGLALRYAQALKATNQKPQAVAVLQQTALRNAKNSAVLAAYGKALAEVGRFTEAAEVLQNAHTPARPDWRVLSAQGAVADQMGDHARAQGFYEAALKIQPDDPTVLSNLGLSYALARQLDQAETVMRNAVAQPRADARVRQNLALVLGLRGKLAEAEELTRGDLTPEEAAANAASLRAMNAQARAPKAPRASSRSVAGETPRG